MDIGKRVRDLRTDKRLSQGELAQRARVARNTVSRIETGHLTPTVTMAAKLASALDVDLGELFESPLVPAR